VHETALVGLPYVVLGVIVAVVAMAFGFTSFPDSEDGRPEGQLTLSQLCATGGRLWRSGAFVQGLLAQVAYVGAQVCIWSFVIRVVQDEVPGTTEQRAADFVLFSLIIFVAGRFVASVLLYAVSESALLCAYAVLAGVMCIIAAAVGGKLGVAAILVSSFFMSMMFPTIFGLVITPLSRRDTEVGAAFLVMAIVGGAVVPPIMGAVSDASSVAVSYLVPGACFVVVASYALQHRMGRFDAGERKPILQ